MKAKMMRALLFTSLLLILLDAITSGNTHNSRMLRDTIARSQATA
jgi:hypothetical protein